MAEYPQLHSIPGGRDLESASSTGADSAAEPAAESAPRPQRDVLRSVPSRPDRPRESRAVREPLWREVLGERLRELRRDHGETLTETAGRAGISPQYLSEIERGRKEPSSEMIAALAGALGTTLGELTAEIAADLLRVTRLAPVRPLAARPPFGPTMLARAA
ncbi:DNA-binding XRE family transcriptional regulator [Nocardia kruczakiae]|uniref:DNA-binding XRE family transcriptional regulator n=1 Tax=Nocardia kruczakiae TaxID=261477 RepID=A0ABU1XCU7_9NOCA|nr:DNA-binding XRE family transcriptional regulator [Nocardia kruczakiae]